MEKPEWLFEANPTGKVPCLQLVNKPDAPFLYESLLIAEYLDEEYPQNKLYPADPLQKVLEKLWIERFSPVCALLHQATIETGEVVEQLWQKIFQILDEFETELKKRGTTYFGGNERANILDYAIWPWLIRIEVSKEIFGIEFPTNRFPALWKWYNALIANDTAVKKWHFPKDIQIKYIESRLKGKVEYDLLAQD